MSMGSLNFDYRLNDHQALLVAILYHYLRNEMSEIMLLFHFADNDTILQPEMLDGH